MFILKKIEIIGDSYPAKIKRVIVSESKDYLKVLEDLKKEVSKKSETDGYYIENSYEFYEYFDNKGKIIYRNDCLTDLEAFVGEDNPKFNQGDIIEYRGFDKLQVGIITDVPLTTKEAFNLKSKLDYSDNTYLIDFSLNQSEHVHAFIFNIKKPRFKVSKEKIKELKASLKEYKKGF